MRLITHNMLLCRVNVCEATCSSGEGEHKNYPLKIMLATTEGALKVEETEPNEEFLVHVFQRLNWDVLRGACSDLGLESTLPEAPPKPEELKEDRALLAELHRCLLDVHVMEGGLVCPNCSRVFVVTKGIPNMLLQETEVGPIKSGAIEKGDAVEMG